MSFKIHRRSLLGWLAGMFSWRVLEALPASVPIFRKRSFLVPLVDAQGNINRTYPASAMSYAEDLGAGVTLEMGLIPGGKFDMGSTSDEPPSYGQEQPIHSVSMKPFLLGAFPVTVAQWRRMASLPQVDYRLYTPAVFLDPNLPIDIVGRLTAVEFCKRLRVLTGRPYRLPSEAEWEYACRAGTTTKYHFGDGISQAVCNYNDGMTRPVAKTLVGSKNAPNRFGLHDMHGNVFEPCRDYLHMTYDGAPTDGSAWLDGEDDILRYHVSRGGCFFFGPDAARSAYRWQISLESAGGYGMRVALDTDVSLMDPQVDPGAIANAASSKPVRAG